MDWGLYLEIVLISQLLMTAAIDPTLSAWLAPLKIRENMYEERNQTSFIYMQCSTNNYGHLGLF
jgi:hypothetical protein